MAQPEISCAARLDNNLGEGPWWDHEGRQLWWLDAWRSRVYRHDPHDGSVQWQLLPQPLDQEPIGSLVLDRQGRLVCAMKRDFWRVDLRQRTAQRLAPAEHDRPQTNRLNDGKCDRAGRYWCGSLNTDWSVASGAVYCLDERLQVTRVIDDFGISNGIAFSPDDRLFYIADTKAGVVWQFDFNLASGEITNRRAFISMPDTVGQFDGATVDADGYYWSALFGAGAVARFDPRGRLVSRIELPTRDPTMCTFGGDALDTLFVTTARRFLDPARLAAEPLAGSLLAIRGLRARGLPEPRFAGSEIQARTAGMPDTSS